jgi:hypothetical protein
MAKHKFSKDVINDVGDEPAPVKAQAPTLPPAPIPGLTPGRMVHYVLSQDEHRPGIITKVNDATTGTINLVVFFDGELDGRSKDYPQVWSKNVEYSEFNVVGTWHFIEKA